LTIGATVAESHDSHQDSRRHLRNVLKVYEATQGWEDARLVVQKLVNWSEVSRGEHCPMAELMEQIINSQALSDTPALPPTDAPPQTPFTPITPGVPNPSERALLQPIENANSVTISGDSPLATMYNKVLATVAKHQALLDESDAISGDFAFLGLFWKGIVETLMDVSAVFGIGRVEEMHKVGAETLTGNYR
jgi:hypothetical protein